MFLWNSKYFFKGLKYQRNVQGSTIFLCKKLEGTNFKVWRNVIRPIPIFSPKKTCKIENTMKFKIVFRQLWGIDWSALYLILKNLYTILTNSFKPCFLFFISLVQLVFQQHVSNKYGRLGDYSFIFHAQNHFQCFRIFRKLKKI